MEIPELIVSILLRNVDISFIILQVTASFPI